MINTPSAITAAQPGPNKVGVGLALGRPRCTCDAQAEGAEYCHDRG